MSDKFDTLDETLLSWNDENFQISYDKIEKEVLIVDKESGETFRFSSSSNKTLYKFIRWMMGTNQYGAYLSEQQVCKYFNISIGTLRGLRKFKGLTPEKLGEFKRSSVRYSLKTILKFKEELDKDQA